MQKALAGSGQWEGQDTGKDGHRLINRRQGRETTTLGEISPLWPYGRKGAQLLEDQGRSGRR